MRELKKLRTRYGIAFQHEMSAQSMDVGSVRGTIQNLGLNINPIESQILDEQRTANELSRQKLARDEKAMELLTQTAKRI